MIEKLKEKYGTYLDETGCSWDTKKAYLQTEVLGFCGCGSPDDALLFLRDILVLIKNQKARGPEIEALLPSDGLYYFVLYMLDNKKITEHGGGVGGSWLSAYGEELLSDIEWCLENENP